MASFGCPWQPSKVFSPLWPKKDKKRKMWFFRCYSDVERRSLFNNGGGIITSYLALKRQQRIKDNRREIEIMFFWLELPLIESDLEFLVQRLFFILELGITVKTPIKRLFYFQFSDKMSLNYSLITLNL